jgi:protein-L-isoaspartate(D-aspartate) O-methyltransferase
VLLVLLVAVLWWSAHQTQTAPRPAESLFVSARDLPAALPPRQALAIGAGPSCALFLSFFRPLKFGEEPRKERETMTAMDGLVDRLKRSGSIKSARVESVMRRVDRARYCPADLAAWAYEDSPQRIGSGQTISAPHMHAMALELLEPYVVRPGSCSLDVGSGSAWMCVALAELADTDPTAAADADAAPATAVVVGIDRIAVLVEWGRANVERDRPHLLRSGRVQVIGGDGWAGCPEHAPYDAIHVGAAADEVPAALVQQLRPGGRMVIPVGPHDHGAQVFMTVDKLPDGSVVSHPIISVQYVPLVKPS